MLRLRRLAKLKELGIIGKDVIPHEVVGYDSVTAKNPEWEEMTDFERQKSARSMECFAGMVDNIDQNLGKIMAYLEKIGEVDSGSVMRGHC